MNHKHFKNARWGVFLLAALLLALCFALSGCDYEDLYPTHEHNFEFLTNVYGEAVYEDGVITDVKRVPCGQWRDKFEGYVCSICGKQLYKPAGSGGTQPCETTGRYKVTTEPTCTKAGVDTATCFYCHKVYTKSVPALGHDYKNVAAKAPTCTEPGNTAGRKCRRCGHLHSGEELPALGHIWSEPTYSWSADLSACTASRVCARGHVETETAKAAVETTGNTCEGGVTTYTATFTNPGFVAQSDTVVFEGVGHSEEIIPGVAATCARTGLTEGKVCSVCGTILEERQKLLKDPNNHEGPFVLRLNADVPSTCTTPGYHTEGICKACGVEVKTELPLDPDNHDWDEPSYEWSADYTTCTATCVCQRNTNHVETQTVNATAGANTATCKAAGKSTYTATFDALFGTLIITVDTPALGHDWGEWTQTKAPTCTDPGEKAHTCQRAGCGATETEVVDALGHDWGAWGNSTATCEAAGTETRACQRDGCGETDTRDADALGHVGGAATCQKKAVCDRCGQEYGDYAAHQWMKLEDAKGWEGEETVDGVEYWIWGHYEVCTVCSEERKVKDGSRPKGED